MTEQSTNTGKQLCPGMVSLFNKLAQDLGQIQDPELTLEFLMRQGIELLEASCAAAILIGEAWQPWQSDQYISVNLPPEVDDEFFQALYSLAADTHEDAPQSTFMVEDLSLDDLSASARLSALDFSACLTLPLTQRGIPLGYLFFLYHHPHAFTAQLEGWAAVLAKQAAIALENSRLVDITLRQAAELGAYHEAATLTAEDSGLPMLLSKIIDQIAAMNSCPYGVLYLADEANQSLKISATYGFRVDLSGLTIEYGEDIAGEVAKSRKPLIFNDYKTWRHAASMAGNEKPIVHLQAVPMILRDRVIGVLELADNAKIRRPFSERDIQLSTSLADQSANLIYIADTIQSERYQRRVAEALQQISLAIGGEVELDDVLDRILEQIHRAFPCDAANIMLVENGYSTIVRHRGYETFNLPAEHISNLTMKIEDFGNLSRLYEGEVVIVSETSQDPSWILRSGFEWIQSWAGAPIQHKGEVIGFINLDSATPGTFDEGTAQFLSTFGNHTAIAIYKVELYQSLSGEHHRIYALNEILQSISGAYLEPTEMLKYLTKGCLEAVHGTFGQAYIMKPRDDSRLERVLEIGQLPEDKSIFQLPRITELIEHTILESTPRQIAISSTDGDYSILCFPIATGKRANGAVLIWSLGGQIYEDTWLDIFQAAGKQAGMALSTAEKHAEVQQRLAEMTLLQNVIGSATSSMDQDAFLKQITDELHTFLGFPAVQIYSLDGAELVLRAYSGPKPLVESLSVDRGIIGRVVRTGVPAMVEKVRQDPDYVSILVGTSAAIAVPFKAENGNQISGVINIATSDQTHANQATLDFLMLLSNQVSIALQNALLYQNIQENVTKLEEQIKAHTIELEEALSLARAADKAKAQFIGDISHELRTPLTNIGLYLDLIEIGDDQQREEYMATLRRETGRLSSLIEQLLAISLIDAGQAEFQPVPTDINSIIQVLVDDRSRLVNEKGLQLEVVPDAHLPMVNVDPQHIIHALTNVLTNAMNYTPPDGKISIKTDLQEWRQTLWVRVSVKDTGPGISETERKRVFDRFYRGLVGKASGIPGTGLGLAISKEIIERNGGRIQADSKSGEGAIFTIWLRPVDDPNDHSTSEPTCIEDRPA